MCQAWAEESVPMQPKSARARIGDNCRSAANYNALSPRSRERIRVTTPANSWEAAKPAAGDAPPAVGPAAPEAAKDAVDLKYATCVLTCLDHNLVA